MDRPIIFLDFDGVVNTHYWIDGECKIYSHKDRRVSNYQAICWLNELYKEIPYDIVVSSTWRGSESIESLEEILHNSGLLPQIRVISKTRDITDGYRGREIEDWIKDNNFTGKFVILDDDADMEPFMDKLVQCHVYVGFSLIEYHKCLEILNS